ncbi:MAG TPA: GNAT family N-acetyltransferase [Terriglobales bacterium]|nr:GNAT family N-acetyltransferase [Terriglobales bacterium]
MASTRRAPGPGNQPAWPMEIIDLRHFGAADLRPLLEKEARQWAEALAWDYRSSAEMILRYVDAKILPGYAAVARGRVCGYAFFVYEGSKGVIGDLYVENGWRNGGHQTRALEERLLTHVIETLQHSPGIHRVEAQLLMHPSDAVARPFLEEGFHRHRRLFMVWHLNSGRGPLVPTMPQEIHVRRWSEADFGAAATIITVAYRNHVDSEINDQYRTVNGSQRFLNNIIRFPGCGAFDAHSSLVAIHKPSKTMVALILCSRVKEDVGHVTQVCVVPEQRGRGIGEALMLACAEDLRRRRFSSLSLTVTEANTGAVELYRKLGFRVARVFDAFVWEG